MTNIDDIISAINWQLLIDEGIYNKFYRYGKYDVAVDVSRGQRIIQVRSSDNFFISDDGEISIVIDRATRQAISSNHSITLAGTPNHLICSSESIHIELLDDIKLKLLQSPILLNLRSYNPWYNFVGNNQHVQYTNIPINWPYDEETILERFPNLLIYNTTSHVQIKPTILLMIVQHGQFGALDLYNYRINDNHDLAYKAHKLVNKSNGAMRKYSLYDIVNKLISAMNSLTMTRMASTRIASANSCVCN